VAPFKEPALLLAGRRSGHQGSVMSWQQRVQQIFDPVIRDAEDMLLSLPYAAIREKTNCLATMLDDLESNPSAIPTHKIPQQLQHTTKVRNLPVQPPGGATSDNDDRLLQQKSHSVKQRPSSKSLENTMCVFPKTTTCGLTSPVLTVIQIRVSRISDRDRSQLRALAGP
jgi:hypothetical protein